VSEQYIVTRMFGISMNWCCGHSFVRVYHCVFIG